MMYPTESFGRLIATLVPSASSSAASVASN